MSDVMRIIMRIGRVNLGILSIRAHRFCILLISVSVTCVVQSIVIGKPYTMLVALVNPENIKAGI